MFFLMGLAEKVIDMVVVEKADWVDYLPEEEQYYQDYDGTWRRFDGQ